MSRPIRRMLNTTIKYFTLSRQAGGLPYADQMFGMLECFGRYALAGEHPANLAGPGWSGQLFDFGDGSAFHLALFDEIVVIGESGYLRQVRYAQHLVRSGKFLETAAHCLRHASADAAIDLIENQGSLGGVRARRTSGRSFQGQCDA